MNTLYLTADCIGTQTGGGTVTWAESEALKTLGPCEVLQRENIGDVHDPFEQDRAFLRIVQDNALPKNYYGELYLAHCYAGCLTETVKELQCMGVKVTYTAAAHDVEVSRREHQKLGLAFDYPHLNDPALWERYLRGYKQADVLVCPSKHSADVMRKYGCTNRIEIIPHGCHLPPQEKIKPLPKIFTVGYLGAVGADKGLMYLLQAWKMLDYKDAVLKIAGQYSASDYMMNLVNTYGGGNIHLAGWQNDLSDFYGSLSLYVQPSACLLPGSPVFSDRGIVSVDQLTSEDRVLVNTGEYKKVIEPLKRRFSGQLISVKTTGVSIATAMTPEHRLLVIRRGLDARKQKFQERHVIYRKVMRMRKEEGIGSSKISQRTGVHPQTIEAWFREAMPHDGHSGSLRSLKEDAKQKSPEWIKASALEKGDVVLFPRIKETIHTAMMDLPQKIRGFHGNGTKNLPRSVVLDNDIMRFFGYYVSEGCATGQATIFCFHSKEDRFMEDVRRVAEDRLGMHAKIWFHPQKNSATVRVEGMLLSGFLIEHFGRGAHNKTIPDWVLRSSEKQLASFIQGAWRGDGSSWQARAGRRGTVYSTVSKSLAYQMFAALVRLGHMPKLSSGKIYGNRGGGLSYTVTVHGNDSIAFNRDVLGVKSNAPKGKKGYRTYIDDDFYYMPITDLSRIAYSGDVFNLEVEDNHCYCAPFIVHNSEGFGCEVLEALAHGRIALCSDGAGAADVVPANHRFRACDAESLEGLINGARCHSDLEGLGKQAREQAEQFTWDKIQAKYIQMWKGLLK